jgi:hypothetical protein
VLPWLPVVWLAVVIVRAWPRLPALMAVHFDAQLQPDSWLPTTATLVSLAPLIVLVSIVATIVIVRDERAALRWGLASVAWQAGMCAAVAEVVAYNVTGGAFRVWPVLSLLTVALVIGAIPTWSKKSSPDASGAVLAEETHRSWPQSIFMLAVGGPCVWVLLFAPRQALVALVPICLLVLYFTTIAVDGFRYRVTSTGIEIRTWLKRMVYIDASDIQACDVCTINPVRDWGGWGVRGIGPSKAYILGGSQALHVTLRDRQLWLGLKNAERLPAHVKDLLARAR